MNPALRSRHLWMRSKRSIPICSTSWRAWSPRGGRPAVDREVMLVGLTALCGGGVAWLVAPLGRLEAGGPAWRREQRAWRQLLLPLVMIAFGTAMWLGWALQ